MVNIVYIVKMEDLLILFVKRWFIQITVEKYYCWLHIVSRGLFNAIVTELRENDPLIQNHQNHFGIPDFFQEDQFNLDEMLFQHMNMDIGFNFDQDDDDYDDDDDDDIF